MSFAIVFTLDLLAALMPLLTNMYLSAPPVISAQLGIPVDNTQITLSIYILDFVLGQLVCGLMTDSFGRKPMVPGGTLVFAVTAAACALAQIIDQLIVMRFFYRLAVTVVSVVINALMRDIYPKEEFLRMISFVTPVITIASLMIPMVGGWVLAQLSWRYIFWVSAVAAIPASTMIFFLIKETLPLERRQPFHIRTTIGDSAVLSRHKRVLSYMLASSFSFTGVFSFLGAGLSVYIEISHVAPKDFGYYFALNILFLLVMTISNSRFIRRIGMLDMFRSGLWIQSIMVARMAISTLLGLGFWSPVIGIAVFVGCVSMVSSNTTAAILDGFPHMAGTASSLVGTFRFGIGTTAGALLFLATLSSAWPMIWSIALCVISSISFCLYVSRLKEW